jgi:rRNA-processing protein FCF1
MKVILDTNFLIDCSKFHIDYQQELKEHDLFVLSQTLNELEKLINQKKAKYSKLALEILQEKGIKILKTTKTGLVDDILVDMKGYAIATNDAELKKRLKTKIFTIRQKKYIKCFTN